MNSSRPEPPAPERRYFAVIGESNDWTLKALASILVPSGFEVVRAQSTVQLLDRTRVLRPDLVVVGESLGGIPAAEACRALTGSSFFNPATPVLVASSGLVREEQRIEHLRAGAWDTIRLPANAEELLLRIQRFIGAKLLADSAQERTLLDARSGFYNLGGLLRRAGEEASEAWRLRRPLSCVVFGPERAAEEALLRDPAGRSRSILEGELVEVFRRLGRKSDVIGRLGETDFIVLAPGTDEAGAAHLARRLLAEMLHVSVPTGEGAGETRPVAMKAGYYTPGDPVPAEVEPEELVSRAAGALRRARVREVDNGEPICSWRNGDEALLPVRGEHGRRGGPAVDPDPGF